MNREENVTAVYKALGEFVIIFQWVEHLYRQIGWFILDPERMQWPPMELRTERIYELINKVTDMFVDLTNTYVFESGTEKAKEMQELRIHFHALRQFRNRLLHSIYIELKGGGEVLGYIRSYPEVGVDTETGELILDQEAFTAETIYSKIREYGDYIFHLNLIYSQLIAWHPFDNHTKNA
jgi:hypothetical protein